MRLDISPAAVIVTLSKRNLLALLQKVDDATSSRTLVSGYVYEDSRLFDGIELVVRCEPDAEHYADREPPGLVHPRAETFIAQMSASAGRNN